MLPPLFISPETNAIFTFDTEFRFDRLFDTLTRRILATWGVRNASSWGAASSLDLAFLNWNAPALEDRPIILVDGSNLFYTDDKRTFADEDKTREYVRDLNAQLGGNRGRVLIVSSIDTMRGTNDNGLSNRVLDILEPLTSPVAPVLWVGIEIAPCSSTRLSSCVERTKNGEGKSVCNYKMRNGNWVAPEASHLLCEFDDLAIYTLSQAMNAKGKQNKVLTREGPRHLLGSADAYRFSPDQQQKLARHLRDLDGSVKLHLGVLDYDKVTDECDVDMWDDRVSGRRRS